MEVLQKKETGDEFTIMIIDDQKIIHEVLRNIIESFRSNLKFVFYMDSEMALVSLNTSKVDLIFCDLNGETIMPFRYFRKGLDTTINVNTPVIRISGVQYSSEEDTDISEGFLAKPFDYSEVANMVNRVLPDHV